MNNIANYLPSQLLTNKKPDNKVFFTDSKPVDSFISSPEKVIQSLPKWLRKTLDYLCMLSNTFRTVFPSYKTLGGYAGVCETTIKSGVKRLVELGLIAKNYLHRRSCRFVVSSWFRKVHNRMRLSNWIVAFKWLPLDLLVPYRNCPNLNRRNGCLCEYCLPYIIDIKNYKSQLSNLVSLTTSRRILSYDIVSLSLGGEKRLPQKRSVMNFNPISIPIRSIKSLRLTKWGQIRLMAFPEKAVEYAEDKMKYAQVSSLKDPFKFFTSLCVDWCKREEIKPNWEIVAHLETAYKAPQNPRYLLEIPKPISTKKISDLPFSELGSYNLHDQRPEVSQKRENRGGTSPMTPNELAKMNQTNEQEEIDLLRQIHHFDKMIANPLDYFKPSPFLFLTADEWVEHTKKMRQQKVDRLADISVRDNPVLTDVVSPLASSGEGEGYVTSDEVCDSVGAYTVEEGWDEYTPEIVLRPTENGQISMWDRVGTPAWRGT